MNGSSDAGRAKKILDIVVERGKCYIDSREVARMVGKRHSDLKKSIAKYLVALSRGGYSTKEYFIESKYIGRNCQVNRNYLCAKKGCDMIANKLTSERGILFTAAYIETFYEIEREINAKRSVMPEYQVERRNMTDAISELPDSPNKKWKFKHYTDLVYKAVTGEGAKGLKKSRGGNKAQDSLTAKELMIAAELEAKIAVLIEAGLEYCQIKEIVYNNLRCKYLQQASQV